MSKQAKILWIIVVSIVALVGITSIALTLLGPKALPIIKYGNFTSPEDIAATSFNVLKNKIRDQKLWVIGIHPNDQGQLTFVSAFIATAKNNGFNFDKILIDRALETNFDDSSLSTEVIDFKNDVTGFANQYVTGETVTVVLTNFISSSHFLRENAIHRLENVLHKGVLAISVVAVGFGPDEKERMPLLCLLGGSDSNGTGPLGCEILQKADYMERKLKGKIPEAKPWSASLDQWGETDFLLFIHQPS